MFAATFLLPLYFQLVRGVDAGSSGALVVPFLAANVVASYFAGASARRLGRTRTILTTRPRRVRGGLRAARLRSSGVPEIATVLASALVGAGVGAVMPVVTVVVQNAIELRDIGAGTGACCSCAPWAARSAARSPASLLISRFDAGIAALHPPLHIDLGALRGGGAALAGLDAVRHAAALGALVAGFELAFWACAILCAVGLGVAAAMRDLPLQIGPPKLSQRGLTLLPALRHQHARRAQGGDLGVGIAARAQHRLAVLVEARRLRRSAARRARQLDRGAEAAIAVRVRSSMLRCAAWARPHRLVDMQHRPGRQAGAQQRRVRSRARPRRRSARPNRRSARRD